MFESIRREIEQEVARKEKSFLDTLKARRLNSAVYYLLILSSGALAYIALLAGLILADGTGKKIYILAAVLLAGSTLVCVEYIRTSTVTWRVATWIKVVVDRRRDATSLDFLRRYYWATIILVIGPFIALLILTLLGDMRLISPQDAQFKSACTGVERAITLSGLLVAAQITLFTFLFSHSLGKYSSKLALVIMRHSAVRSLLICGLVGLAVPLLLVHVGIPSEMNRHFGLFHTSLFACLVLTVLVSCKGVDTDALILFAGQYYASRLRRRLRPPVARPDGTISFWWKLAGKFALDLRHPERFVLHAEPWRAAAVCKGYLMSLFNAASEAIHRNQQESLRACLHAIATVMDSYSRQRAPYQCSTDSVYSYCNDHFAALLGLASKSPNEHMSTDIVRYIGAVAGTGLRAGGADLV